MVARHGRLLRARNDDDPTGPNPRNHDREQLRGAPHGLRDRDLRGIWLELLDPTAQGPDVRDLEGANCGALEVMAALSGFDENDSRARPGDRNRESGETRTRAKVDEGLRTGRKSLCQCERLQNQARSQVGRGSMASQVDPAIPAFEEVGEKEQLLLLALGQMNPQLREPGDEDLPGIRQVESPRAAGGWVFHVKHSGSGRPKSRREKRDSWMPERRIAPFHVERSSAMG